MLHSLGNVQLLLKNWMMGTKPHKKKTVSVNFNHAPFSVLFNHDDSEMQALVWLCMVWFRVICFGISFANLRRLRIFKDQI